MTPVVDLTRARGTGPVRMRRPIYTDLLPPCNNACPAGENTQAWLELAQAGKYRQAWETLVRDNPMPAVHGRVCYHPCEGACNRAELDSAVSIHAVERFLGDLAGKQGWPLQVEAASTGKRVLVIGAGVAQHVDIPARDAARVLDAVSLLRDVKAGETPRLGRRVVVYGGGIPRWTRRAPLGAWAPTRRSSFIGVIAHTCRRMPSKRTRP